ncbi:hypothetical protein Tco_1518518, partial [Tanacetum coccineum]
GDGRWLGQSSLLVGEVFKVVAAGRKSGAHISGGQFVARLVDHFGLLTAEILGGLTVVALKHPVIDMAELVRLQISVELDDTWAWVAMGPERQPDAAAGSPTNAEDAPIVDEGGQANLALVQGCWELMWTCGEINDQSGEILHMVDDVYDAVDGC